MNLPTTIADYSVRRSLFYFSITIFFLLISCATRPASIENAVLAWQEIVPGLAWQEGKTSDPRLEFWAIRADLSKVEIAVSGGPQAAGAGAAFPAARVSTFARETGSLAAINANPFDRTGAAEGEPLVPAGLVVSGGAVLSPPNPQYAALVFYDDSAGGLRAAVMAQEDFAGTPEGARFAAGGFYQILRNGAETREALSERGSARHPRSAAGVSAGGKILYLLVIDGRRPGSAGATEGETARLLAKLGAADGLCFDGGGSSALALRAASVAAAGAVKILNKPGGILNKERAVAVCLGLLSP